MLEVNYVATKTERSGRLVHEEEIRKRLKGVNLNLIEYAPPKINIKVISLAARLVKKLLLLTWQVKIKAQKNNITHITSEDLAYLLNFIKFKRTIVTCHDLIPLVYQKKYYSPFLRLNMKGLKKADRIITVSNFSKNDIVRYLGYPEDKIDVIYNAVDHHLYYPKRNREILKKYNLPENTKIILYVGSEHKRQNLEFLVKGLYEFKKILPEVKLIKIGNPQHPKARKNLLGLVKKLDLEKEVIFTGYVNEEELINWYNAADLFVYPCLYAGFSIPPLEAMACGLATITSNTSSLPEVIGNGGIMINPYDKNQLVKAMYEVLTDENLRKDLIERGLQRAKLFSWERAARQTENVYQKLFS